MKIDEAVSILRAHNEWRRAPAHIPEDARPAMGDPRKIGIAIDTVCDALSATKGDAQPVAFLCRECDEEGWSTYVVMPHEVPPTGEFLHVVPLYAAPVATQPAASAEHATCNLQLATHEPVACAFFTEKGEVAYTGIYDRTLKALEAVKTTRLGISSGSIDLYAAPVAAHKPDDEAKGQIEALDLDNHRLRRAMQKVMARLTNLLDEDQFGNIESIVTEAGVEPPEAQNPDDARDAARYRWLRDHGFQHAVVCLGTDFDGDNFVSYRIDFNLPEPAHMKFEDDEWGTADVDAAIDAAMREDSHG